MHRNLNCLLILLLVSIPLNAAAQDHGIKDMPTDSLTRLIHAYLISANKSYHFNGTVLVASKGKILLSKGYGFSDMTTKRLNTPDTRFPILSIGKTFTSAVILRLQEEKKI